MWSQKISLPSLKKVNGNAGDNKLLNMKQILNTSLILVHLGHFWGRTVLVPLANWRGMYVCSLISGVTINHTFSINRDYDVWFNQRVFDSTFLLVQFSVYPSQGALSELLYCEIKIDWQALMFETICNTLTEQLFLAEYK